MTPALENGHHRNEDTDSGPPVSAQWALAKEKLSVGAWGYFFGGSGAESTLRANNISFSTILFRPRGFTDVSEIDTSTQLHKALSRLPLPLLIAPMALQTLAHPCGELATAAAAAAHGIPLVLSMFSGISVERVAKFGGPILQQIYVLRDRDLTLRITHRARASGASGLVLTADAPYFGRRRRDEGTAFALPPGVEPAHLTGSRARFPSSVAGQSALAEFGRHFIDPSVNFGTLRWLIRESGLPVWVKGILRGDDAAAAVEAGATGIFVSNHGGRQLDGAICAIDALEEVVRAVGDKVPVVVDSGVRTPEDVLKAVALGAKAAMVGRPVLAALAADGERGVRKLLQEWKQGVKLNMALCGVTKCSEIGRDLVVTANEPLATGVRALHRAKL